ncbi:hypothetical protein QP228_008115 [Pseudoglutamicibacter cumminsii]|uniref:hypothetical protein n=1 Tax=Pseudoglutamicibacter cumminsii TaxID=156979 RepID=UPI002AB8FC4C|nr:hypothetical protein [Pseudoglutamicibacter cumminsii]MDZ3745935.1 hypothetical protein [Pseudoglutamicibacter cumminsii]
MRLIFGFGLLALFPGLLEFALGLAAALVSAGATDSDGAADSDELTDSDGAADAVLPDSEEDSEGPRPLTDPEELAQPASPNATTRLTATAAFAVRASTNHFLATVIFSKPSASFRNPD